MLEQTSVLIFVLDQLHLTIQKASKKIDCEPYSEKTKHATNNYLRTERLY